MADTPSTLRDSDEEKYVGMPANGEKGAGLPLYDRDEQMRRGSVTPYHSNFFSSFTADSFKRNPNARVVTEATDAEGRPLPNQPPAEPALAMELKNRHLQMIAIGGSIGESSFY